MEPTAIEPMALIGRQINITARCPCCGVDLKVVAKLPMHTFILECAGTCELGDIRIKVKSGKIISVLRPQAKGAQKTS